MCHEFHATKLYRKLNKDPLTIRIYNKICLPLVVIGAVWSLTELPVRFAVGYPLWLLPMSLIKGFAIGSGVFYTYIYFKKRSNHE